MPSRIETAFFLATCAATGGELLLTHISGRYKPEEIQAEAAGLFPKVRTAADFDRVSVSPRVSS